MIALSVTKIVKLHFQPASRLFLNIGCNGSFPFVACMCTSYKDEDNKSLKLPEEPQNCCMSGCANCVWIAYANELAEIMNDGGEMAKNKIIENVKDPNLRSFLMLELCHLIKDKK